MFDQILSSGKIQDNKSYSKLIEKPIHACCFASIVIPVRDEAELIEKCLAAFPRQADAENNALGRETFEVIILANNCTDNTVELIENFRRENPSLRIHLAEVFLEKENCNIGFIRRILMNEAFERLQKNRFGKGVILTTDGDTIVADDWISANLREIETGADAVGGRIIIDGSELEKMDSLCRDLHVKDEEYRLLAAEIEDLIDDLPFDNAPRHHQHFNGSFACTTEIYEKAGGLPDVKFLEDVAFFDRLQRIDARVRHSPNVKVFTSSRNIGRSEVGLSFQLNLWKNLREAKEDFLVESTQAMIERFNAKKILRKIWRRFAEIEKYDLTEIKNISEKIFVSQEVIIGELKNQNSFGAFYETLIVEQNANGEWARKFPPVALDLALEDLRAETETHRCRQSFSQTSIR